jgi:t-SNARE complex subunit (syntaxin)
MPSAIHFYNLNQKANQQRRSHHFDSAAADQRGATKLKYLGFTICQKVAEGFVIVVFFKKKIVN